MHPIIVYPGIACDWREQTAQGAFESRVERSIVSIQRAGTKSDRSSSNSDSDAATVCVLNHHRWSRDGPGGVRVVLRGVDMDVVDANHPLFSYWADACAFALIESGLELERHLSGDGRTCSAPSLTRTEIETG